MAKSEKKGGIFSRFKKNQPAEPREEKPEASVAKSATTPERTPPPNKPSAVKPAPSAEPAEEKRSDSLEPVDTAASIENFFRTLLYLSVEHLKMADNAVKTLTENLNKISENMKGKSA